MATKLVNIGQGRIDPKARMRRLAHALETAKKHHADHFVISGDLTEVGEDAEFEQFAQILHDAGLPDDSVTLVPGNHDVYTRGDAWARAMRGPLARFAASSAAASGKVVDRGAVVFLPIDTTRFQTMAWSGGLFTQETASKVAARLSDPAFRDKAMVMVMHHPPFHPVRAMNWFDGLRGAANVLHLLFRHPRLVLLHGHLHRIFNHILASSSALFGHTGRAPVLRQAEAGDTSTRLFGAPATMSGPDEPEDPSGVDPVNRVAGLRDLRERVPCDSHGLRLYDVVDGLLRALEISVPIRAA